WLRAGSVQIFRLPATSAAPATAQRVLSAAGQDRERVEPATWHANVLSRYPASHAAPLPRRWANATDAIDLAVCARRLQLPAPGSVRNACFPFATGRPAIGARGRFLGW